VVCLLINLTNSFRICNQELKNYHRKEVHNNRFKRTFVTTKMRNNVQKTNELIGNDLLGVIYVQLYVYVSIFWVVGGTSLQVVIDINVLYWFLKLNPILNNIFVDDRNTYNFCSDDLAFFDFSEELKVVVCLLHTCLPNDHIRSIQQYFGVVIVIELIHS
jgi:hypothetical protein